MMVTDIILFCKRDISYNSSTCASYSLQGIQSRCADILVCVIQNTLLQWANCLTQWSHQLFFSLVGEHGDCSPNRRGECELSKPVG